MVRTNTAQRRSSQILRTHEGAPARRINAEQELRRSVMACLLWENEFYEDGIKIADRIADLCEQVDVETVAQIAIKARTQMYLRHVPLWIVRQLARRDNAPVADTLETVIQRADELAEFLALYWKDGKQPLSAQVKKGLARAFRKFDAYALAKYNRDGAVKLRDVLFMCHAKPKDEVQAATWRQLIDGTLPEPGTWENRLSAGEDKKQVWFELMSEQKLGGLALLRNLRNIQEAGIEDGLIRTAIAANKFKYVLPFRFVAAARFAPKFEPDLEAAMFRSLAEMPKLSGKTALVVDHSGSMQLELSQKSQLNRFNTACALGMLLREVCEECLVIAFSYDGAIVPARRGFALRDAILQAVPWGGTYTENAKQLADREGYDRIVIVSDEQSHQPITAPNGNGYVINVASNRRGIGYGKWTHIDGWSENVLRYIQECEA